MGMPYEENLSQRESEYEQYFTAPDHKDRPSDLDSLEQPSPLHVIQTKTTYGCSELELIE